MPTNPEEKTVDKEWMKKSKELCSRISSDEKLQGEKAVIKVFAETFQSIAIEAERKGCRWMIIHDYTGEE